MKDWSKFEASIELICLEYARANRGVICKVDPPMKVFGHGRSQRVVFLENPFVDYIGSVRNVAAVLERGRATLKPSGTMITFEAKQTRVPRLGVSAAKKSNGLKVSQLENLKGWRRSGAITGLLWQYAEPGRDPLTRWFTIDEIDAAIETRKSIPWSDEYGTDIPLRILPTPSRGFSQAPDFLDVAIN